MKSNGSFSVNGNNIWKLLWPILRNYFDKYPCETEYNFKEILSEQKAFNARTLENEALVQKTGM
jgi:hypothetical protein